jgi:D-3-phosphoglycerate dehydrogenase
MAIILANDGIDKLAKAKLEELGHTVDTDKYEDDALLSRLAEVDAVIVRSATKIRRKQLEAGKAGRLSLVIRAGVGVDNIDVEAAKELGIEVRNTPEASSNAVAEVAFGHMLALTHHIYHANVSMRQRKWLKKEYVGSELSGRTLGLIGYGRIAKNLAQKAGCFGMDVIFTKRSPAKQEDGIAKQVSFGEILQKSDIISLHMPSIGKAIIGAEEIAQMKDGVFLINTARGGLIDETALLDALDSGKVAGAALDVFSVEPVTDERIYTCEKLSLTPHIGAATKEAQMRIGDVIVAIIKEYF